MNKIVLLFLLCISSFAINAQSESDSLYNIWQDQSETDSIRVKAYKAYIWDNHLFSNPDSAIILAEAMYAFADEQDYPIARNQANTLIGIAHDILGDFNLAIEYIQKSLDGNEKIGNKRGISECEIVIGVTFDQKGNYPRALEHYNKALIIDEEIGNKEGMAMSLNNIGNIYSIQGDTAQAMKHYKRALAIDEELGVKQGIATELSNIGGIYGTQGDEERAIEYYERALDLYEEIGDMEGAASTIKSLGNLYDFQEKDALALDYFERALEIFENLGNKVGIAQVEEAIGSFYLDEDEEELAVEYCESSLEIAEEIGALDQQNEACECLYLAHKDLGNNREALDYHEQMVSIKELIYNEENTKKLTRIQMQYEFDKKVAATKAEQERKDTIAQQQLKRQKLVRNGFMGGFTVVLLFAGVFFVQRNRISKEKERSEELLLNILPEETAKELKEKGHADAQLIDQVTVLFTDFKGFTAMSEKLSPKDLVNDLHLCFSLFDQICEKYGIEKIKTIGDAYMAAGGLPTPNNTHANDVVKAALEMAQVVEDGKAKKIAAGLPFFEIRVGVHTGPVVAGIVGIKKFQYDIWGDTVNTASRMESSGEVGKVNISQSTYALVKDQFNCVYRGEIAAKGKGKLGMYFASWKVLDS